MSMPESGSAPRLFFALWPDQKTRGRMEEIQQGFKTYKARWTKPDKLHITLNFIGTAETARVPSIINSVSDVGGSRFQLVLDYAMPIYRSNMLWLTPKHVPDELFVLVKRLSECLRSCGFEPEARRFRPHVTLARKMRDNPVCQDVDPIHWPIDSLALVESKADKTGSHYIVREVWPFT